MKYNRKVEGLNATKAQMMEFLTAMANYEGLMPEETKSFELLNDNQGFKVIFGSLPRVTLKLQEEQQTDQINFESPNPSFEYYLNIIIEELADNKTDVTIDFDGRLNAMIQMIAKKPLTHFLDSIADNLEKKFAA